MKTYTLLALLCLLSIAAVYRPSSPGTPPPVETVPPPVETVPPPVETVPPPVETVPPPVESVPPPVETVPPPVESVPPPVETVPPPVETEPPDKQPHLDHPAAQERTLPRSGYGPPTPTFALSAHPLTLRAERSRSSTHTFILLLIILAACWLIAGYYLLKSL